MGNEQRLAGIQPYYEALMSTAVVVVREDADDDTAALRLSTISEWLRRAGRRSAALRERLRRVLCLIELFLQEIKDQNSDKERDEFFHNKTKKMSGELWIFRVSVTTCDQLDAKMCGRSDFRSSCCNCHICA